MPLPWETVPLLAAGVLNIVLALVLLRLDFWSPVHRAFSLLLVLRGVAHAQNALLAVLGAGTAGWDLANRITAWFVPPIAFVTVYFVTIYPRRRRWMPSGPWGAALFLLPAAAEVLLLRWDSLLYGPTPPVGSFTSFSDAARLFASVFPLAALVLAWDATRSQGARRHATLLVSLGFALVALSDSGGIHAAVLTGQDPAPPFLAVPALLLDGALLVALVALLVREALREHDDAGYRRRLRRYLLLLPLPYVTTFWASFIATPTDFAWAEAMVGVWRLPFPILITYALLKHQLFDVDVKLKWTIKQSTVAGAFIGLFFVVSEGAQQVFSESIGPYLGIAAAGMLLFAIAPLQHFADRLANAAVPHAKTLGALSQDERAALYRQQLEVAWADGSLTMDERRLLDALRERLGLSLEEANRLEREATAPR